MSGLTVLRAAGSSLLSVVSYQVVELGQVSIVSEARLPLSLEFSVCLSGTEEAQGTGTEGAGASWLCHPSLSSIVLRSLGVHEAGPDRVHPGGAA